MFDITEKDVLSVYNKLKHNYDLLLTRTVLFDECFTINTTIIVGRAHGQIITLYACDDMFVMDVLNEQQTMGTHWHPYDIDSAVDDIVDFMNGKSDYSLHPLG